MANDLAAFRESWKQELTSKKEEQRLVSASSTSRSIPEQASNRDSKNRYFEDLKNPSKEQSEACSPLKSDGCTEDKGRVVGGGEEEAAAKSEDQPEYVSIARSLLDGRTSPLLERIEEERSRRKRQYHNVTNVRSASLQQQQHQHQQPQRKVKKDEELLEQLIQDLV